MLRKLMVGTAAGFVLLGVSAASIAQEADDCADGVIAFKTVSAIVVNEQICVVYNSVVEGEVTVTNSPSFNMTFTDVGGPVTIEGDGVAAEHATVLRVDVLEGRILVSGYEIVVVAGNTLQKGNLKVNDNLAAVVQRNVVNGDIECVGNVELDVGGNRARGEVNCTPN